MRHPKRAQAASSTTNTEISFNQDEVAQVRQGLLAWYDVNHRVLPWRRTPHSKCKVTPSEDAEPAPAHLDSQQFAYYVWVSEIMLQQTQVATVTSYFKRWISKWSSVRALADANQEEVNEVWAGLGYYRRARYLLDGANYIVSKLGGSFPTTARDMLQIPGVGPYTAAAVASIAFGDPAAAVDGNVIRVVSRLRALSGDPRKLTATHQALASQLLSPERPGDYNQAMMELGATVCRPANPDCGGCPVQGACEAHAQWSQYLAGGGAPDIEDAPRVTRFPEKVEKAAKKEQHLAVVVLEVLAAGGGSSEVGKQRTVSEALGRKAGKGQRGAAQTLLVKRPEEGLLAGLWEFPGVVLPSSSMSPKQRQLAADKHLLGYYGIDLSTASPHLKVVSRKLAGTATHVFSHVVWTLHVERVQVVGGLQELKGVVGRKVPGGRHMWLPWKEVGGKGLSTSVKKVWKLVA